MKDSLSAPQTGWVFTTLVYDKDAPGRTVLDKMVPLGAQWGNDPQATRAGMPAQGELDQSEGAPIFHHDPGLGRQAFGPQ